MLRGIEAERIRKGLTKEELARNLNVSMKTYYNWINEETDVPGSALVKMSGIFGVKIERLLEGMSGVQNSKNKKGA